VLETEPPAALSLSPEHATRRRSLGLTGPDSRGLRSDQLTNEPIASRRQATSAASRVGRPTRK